MDYAITANGELCHYGVKGQKWGIRRYQNKDGSLTPAGKKRAKQEYKEDNKKAFELGKNATITGRAVGESMKRTAKLEKKLDKRREKDPTATTRRTKSLQDQLEASTKTTEQLTATYKKYKTEAEAHCKSLVQKYGKEAVSSIKYKDFKTKNGKINTINERTNTMTGYAVSGLSIVGATLAVMAGAPVGIYQRPLSTGEKVSRLESSVFVSNLPDRRKEQRK